MDDPQPELEPTDGMTAVVEPKKRPAKDKKRKGIPRYHVILWDDDDHSFEYVITMLQDLFGHTVETGFKLAKTVDTAGKVTVLTTTKEHAELKCEQIHAYGKDASIKSCKGSMTASIESAE